MEIVYHHLIEGYDESEQLCLYFLPPGAPKVRLPDDADSEEFRIRYSELVKRYHGKLPIGRSRPRRDAVEKVVRPQPANPKLRDALPVSLPPRGLSREIAA